MKNTYLTPAVGTMSKLYNWPMHSFQRFGGVALMQSKDCCMAVKHMLEACGIAHELGALKGVKVCVAGKVVTLRKFIVFDEQSGWKTTRGDGPTCTAAGREPCPYCNAPPEEVYDYVVVPQPINPLARPSAVVRGISPRLALCGADAWAHPGNPHRSVGLP